MTYPHVAGWKDHTSETSQTAAESVDTATVRAQVFAVIRQERLTADEIATRLALSILTVRPRVSELRRLALVEDSGTRRRNASGRPAIVWQYQTRMVSEQLTLSEVAR